MEKKSSEHFYFFVHVKFLCLSVACTQMHTKKKKEEEKEKKNPTLLHLAYTKQPILLNPLYALTF